MAESIRPKDLPPAVSAPADAAIIIDNGTVVQKATPAQIADTARPFASQPEAEAGADNGKTMTPLRTKQAIDSQIIGKAQASAIGVAGSENNMGTTPGTILSDGGTAKQWFQESEAAIEVGGQFLQSGTGAVVRTGQDKQREIVSVKDFGALGDGSTNDTLAFENAWAAVASGGQITVPDGTYMLDYIDGINKPVHWRLNNGATLKQRVPASPATTLNGFWGIFEFVAGSQGSTVSGGTIDGNRTALAAYYPATTRLGSDPHWWGIRTNYVDDISIRDIVFRNVMNEAFYFYGGERQRAKNVRVYDSGVAFVCQGSSAYSSGYDIEVYAEGIGNVVSGTAYYFFQHGAIWGFLRDGRLICTIKNFYGTKQGTDGVATGGGKEPEPIALAIYGMKNCRISAIANTYSATDPLAGKQQAFTFSSVTDSIMDFTCFDYEQGLYAGTAQNCDITVNLDGNYRRVMPYVTPGLTVTFGGIFGVVGAGLAGETNANNTSNNVTFRGSVTRFGVGVRDEGANTTYSPGFNASGNVSDNWQLVGPSGPSASYPTSRNRPNGGRTLIGVYGRFGGQSGLVYTRGTSDLVRDSDFSDNGQQTGSRSGPYGIWVLADAAEGKNLRIVNNNVEGNPGVVDTAGLSYAPGTATAAPAGRFYDINTSLTHVYQFIFRNPNRYGVGQFVKLKNVLAGPADATGKIIDIQADVFTIAFSSALTFVATSTLGSLTGTGTTSGTTLTGSGTAFTTEVDFPMYLKSGSEYRRIVYVNSNTSAVIDSPFSSNLSGAALQVVKGNIETGVYIPTHAVVVNGNVTAGPFLLRDNRAKNVPNSITFTSFPGLDAGSRFDLDYSLTMAGTGLVNSIVSGLPQYAQVCNVRSRFDTAITGLTGGAEIQIREGGVNKKTAITGFSGVTLGTMAYGPTPDAPAFTTTGGDVSFVSGSGNPSGTITVRLTLQKYAYA